MRKRRCMCGTILSQYNPSDECWACEESRRIRNLPKPGEKVTPTSTGNPSGLCKCGCGGQTPIAKRNRHVENILAGMPVHYIPGHALIRPNGTNGRAKLTADRVREMRREYAKGGLSYKEIARKYGCRKQTAIDAIKGKTWSNLMDEAA